jgi:AMP nucleosidase
MPAYHLKLPDKNGITLINVGVGPSNMKTMTDHLAVLRPHCWLMLGHCAGLLHTQRLGDYVLANGYMRDDHVLDEELPLSIPIPPMAEIQQALVEAAGEFMVDLDELEMRRCLRSGTVLSTGNRNWELRIRELSRILNLSRALAVDMESATLAANAFRFSIPYGALLCVSDRPLHGELKLHGQARSFYQQRVQQHLSIGLRALEILRSKTMMSLHSRKLRGFQRTPFR